LCSSCRFSRRRQRRSEVLYVLRIILVCDEAATDMFDTVASWHTADPLVGKCNAVMVEASSRIGCLLTEPVLGSTSGDVSFMPQCNIQTTVRSLHYGIP
jgi:hypothetical protein